MHKLYSAVGDKSSSHYSDSIEAQDSIEKAISNITFSNGVPEGPYKKGGMPLMSDSLFSLVILIYVSVAFLFVFFMFCWKNGNNGSGTMGSKGTNENLKCPLMSLEDIIGGKKQQDKPQSIMMNILNDIEDDFNTRQVKIIPCAPFGFNCYIFHYCFKN